MRRRICFFISTPVIIEPAHMGVKVSVLMIVYNEESHIERAIESILNQSYQDFELIIVDDGSNDGTYQKISQYLKNEKVHCFRNDKNQGIAYSRNLTCRKSKGDFIFFMDADCIATRYWIQEGLEMFQRNPKLFGLQGVTYYENCLATVSNQITQVLSPRQYQTCNMAYRRIVWEKVGGFDESYANYEEDYNFARRVIKICGEIGFDRDLIVIHQEKLRDLKTIFSRYKSRTNSQVIYHLKEGKKGLIVLNPLDLLFIVFPFLLLLWHRFRRFRDIKYALFLYFATIYSRFCIWKLAIKNKKLIL